MNQAQLLLQVGGLSAFAAALNSHDDVLVHEGEFSSQLPWFVNDPGQT
jgi:hypothetical protein